VGAAVGSDERWVGVDEVATHLGVGRDSIYRWIESRGLPARKVGRLLRFKLSEVDAWVEAGGGRGSESPRSRPRSGRHARGKGRQR
jgi:excisionase family DNA binding protein